MPCPAPKAYEAPHHHPTTTKTSPAAISTPEEAWHIEFHHCTTPTQSLSQLSGSNHGLCLLAEVFRDSFSSEDDENNDHHNHHHDHCSALIVQCIHFTDGLCRSHLCQWSCQSATVLPLRLWRSTDCTIQVRTFGGSSASIGRWSRGLWHWQQNAFLSRRSRQRRRLERTTKLEALTLQHGKARTTDSGMAPWPALHRHQEMSLSTLAGNDKTSKMETHVNLFPSTLVMIVKWLWSYETNLQKMECECKNNSISKCIVINKTTMYISELASLFLSDLMVKVIHFYFVSTKPSMKFSFSGQVGCVMWFCFNDNKQNMYWPWWIVDCMDTKWSNLSAFPGCQLSMEAFWDICQKEQQQSRSRANSVSVWTLELKVIENHSFYWKRNMCMA